MRKLSNEERIRAQRTPRHVGLIPDGIRRWADAHGLPQHEGYAAGIGPGLRLVRHCRALGIEELSISGFTLENTHRPAPQVAAFQSACVEFSELLLRAGVALLVIGECSSSQFPAELQPFTLQRSPGDLRVNLLVNYGWQSVDRLSRIDLVVRWGGRRRLSGFLPLQSAHADLHFLDTLWPDMQPEEFDAALAWYARQEHAEARYLDSRAQMHNAADRSAPRVDA